MAEIEARMNHMMELDELADAVPEEEPQSQADPAPREEAEEEPEEEEDWRAAAHIDLSDLKAGRNYQL